MKTETITLLLVEDDEIDARSVIRQVKQAAIPAQVARARDGVEALAMLRGEADTTPVERPFFIVSDINMPRMDGIELLQQLRQDRTLSDAVVFILTTSHRDQDYQQCYRNQIAGYMAKDQIDQDLGQLTRFLNDYCTLVELPDEPVNR